ncbi:MAG: tetratricopeptide repeat protein [Chthoniobacterales bacterium]
MQVELLARSVDLLSQNEEQLKLEALLSADRDTMAQALALYAKGIFDEQSGGAENALKSYEASLALNSENLRLALRVAQEYLRRGENAQALSILKDAAKKMDKNFLLPLMISNIYLRQLQKPDFAEKYAAQAAKLAPDLFMPVSMQWEILKHQGNNEQAEKLLEKAAESENESPWYWLRLAELRSQENSTKSSLQNSRDEIFLHALNKAFSHAEDSPEILSQVAEFFVVAQLYEKAETAYEDLYKLKPDFPDLPNKLAMVYLRNQRLQKAKPLLEKIIEDSPQSLWANDALEEITLKEGKLEETLTWSQRGLSLAPQQVNRHLNTIDLLLKMQRYETASMYAEQARKRFPGAGTFTFLQAVALSRAEQYEKALASFEGALIEAATGYGEYVNADFYFEYGVASEQTQAYKKAAELFKKSIEMDPQKAARVCNYLGYMWAERGENLAEAEQLIRRALTSEPENGAYLDSLGWVYFKQKRYSEALIELLRAVELMEAPDPVVFDHIADTYNALGRQPEAILYWQKALQIDSENADILKKINQFSERVVRKNDV